MEVENKRIRAQRLEHMGFNGFDLILIKLLDENSAELEVHFLNNIILSDILRAVNDNGKKSYAIFPIIGGERVLAGEKEGQVKVEEIKGEIEKNILKLTIRPIGDYSTYTLRVGNDFIDRFDPVFNEIKFKTRPGCFNTICHKIDEWDGFLADPTINYLAKDFESFKHIVISAMTERISGWKITSEADLEMTLIELLCAKADELSDFQDRVFNEAFISTSKKRVSLERHARLMNYHIYQGNQASTWLAIELRYNELLSIPAKFRVQTEEIFSFDKPIIYSTKEKTDMHYLLNRLTYYTWDNIYPILKAGSNIADLRVLRKLPHEDSYEESNNENDYKKILELIEKDILTFLIIQEVKDPKNGKKHETASPKSQLLKINKDKTLKNNKITNLNKDSINLDPNTNTSKFFIRLYWEERDQLKSDYIFTSKINEGTERIQNISLFYGNLVKVYQGRYKSIAFFDPDVETAKKRLLRNKEYYYERTNWGVICSIPDSPLAFEDKYDGKIPNGEYAPKSTLIVHVDDYENFTNVEWNVNDSKKKWCEVLSLIHSNNESRHFNLETDEHHQSLIRFGNGINGKDIPKNGVVRCTYQIGLGREGNIGADKLIKIPFSLPDDQIKLSNRIKRCWNPFEITNGQDPEPTEEIIRNVPETYKLNQERAITVNKRIDDYENRAEELEGVHKALARYKWMGSWRIVQLSIDPVEMIDLSEDLRDKILSYIDAVRLIGDQIVIKSAKYVPLEIYVLVCIHPDYWIKDVKSELEEHFSDKFTRNGNKAFFHPDLWTFGQPLKKSQIIGRIQAITGVHHVVDSRSYTLIIKKWMSSESGLIKDEFKIQPHEIIQVKSDPIQMEKGYIYFEFEGGRK